MKTTLAVILAVANIVSCAFCQDWDFTYSYREPFSANSDQYVFASQGLSKQSEGNVRYFRPNVNGVEGTITYKFQFQRTIQAAHLATSISTYSFSGDRFGSGSIWGSNNGTDWIRLLDAPKPVGKIDQYYKYDAAIPPELLGGSTIYIQARLLSSGWNIMAQFSRIDISWEPDDVFRFYVKHPKPAIQVDGAVELTVAAPDPLLTYTLQYSDDLTTWHNDESFTGRADTIQVFRSTRSVAKRFWRIVEGVPN